MKMTALHSRSRLGDWTDGECGVFPRVAVWRVLRWSVVKTSSYQVFIHLCLVPSIRDMPIGSICCGKTLQFLLVVIPLTVVTSSHFPLYIALWSTFALLLIWDIYHLCCNRYSALITLYFKSVTLFISIFLCNVLPCMLWALIPDIHIWVLWVLTIYIHILLTPSKCKMWKSYHFTFALSAVYSNAVICFPSDIHNRIYVGALLMGPPDILVYSNSAAHIYSFIFQHTFVLLWCWLLSVHVGTLARYYFIHLQGF